MHIKRKRERERERGGEGGRGGGMEVSTCTCIHDHAHTHTHVHALIRNLSWWRIKEKAERTSVERIFRNNTTCGSRFPAHSSQLTARGSRLEVGHLVPWP